MRDQLISLLAERAGLNEEQAGQAVDAVLGFVREHPEQLAALLGDNAPVDLDRVAGSVRKLFGR